MHCGLSEQYKKVSLNGTQPKHFTSKKSELFPENVKCYEISLYLNQRQQEYKAEGY